MVFPGLKFMQESEWALNELEMNKALSVCNFKMKKTVHQRITNFESVYLKWTKLQNVSKTHNICGFEIRQIMAASVLLCICTTMINCSHMIVISNAS